MKNFKEAISLKFVIIGDCGVGKSSVIYSYQKGQFQPDLIPIPFENFIIQDKNDENQNIILNLQEISGSDDYRSLRPSYYESADLFLIIFSVIDSNSFDHAISKWYPELNQNQYLQIPKIFLGNKIDLREIKNNQHINNSFAQKIIQAYKIQYFECSALTQEGINQVFKEASKRIIKIKKENQIENNGNKLCFEINHQITKEEEPCCLIF
ncbi:unnamed protein product [Paramecium sonneborni]|uniref:Uncharacterized protein n=1 Tax=Paramecium sonneborni TaxID=65129 RepID=A0A8S1RFI6_9CILI|nr:unnamed protein product [Paramecium sonneborni]